MNRLFSSPEDFFASFDKGTALIQGPLCDESPPDSDKDALKSLLALFIGATIQMDPKAFNDPELQQKLTVVRMGLLAAYNLGGQHDRVPQW